MHKHRVLIVDDEVHITAVVAAKLRRAGMEVSIASDGEEALRFAQEKPFDLVIADLAMPRIDGLQLSRRLAADGRTAAIPVMIITARGHTLSEHDLTTANIRALIAKPFSPRDILERATALLSDVSRTELGEADGSLSSAA